MCPHAGRPSPRHSSWPPGVRCRGGPQPSIPPAKGAAPAPWCQRPSNTQARRTIVRKFFRKPVIRRARRYSGRGKVRQAVASSATLHSVVPPVSRDRGLPPGEVAGGTAEHATVETYQLRAWHEPGHQPHQTPPDVHGLATYKGGHGDHPTDPCAATWSRTGCQRSVCARLTPHRSGSGSIQHVHPHMVGVSPVACGARSGA